MAGFTVNSHQWLPGFEPPYVVANIALAEDPNVRLTTNIIGCEPTDVHIGQESSFASSTRRMFGYRCSSQPVTPTRLTTSERLPAH